MHGVYMRMRVQDAAEARRLELQADAVALGEWTEFEAPRLRLARARGDLSELRRLVDSATRPVAFVPYEFDMPAALLDAFVALGDQARIEAEAPEWLKPNTYLEPFALPALGVARGDGRLLAQAEGTRPRRTRCRRSAGTAAASHEGYDGHSAAAWFEPVWRH